MNYKENKSKGLTIIELLIVVSIIGILSGITVTVINAPKQAQKAKNAQRASNLEKIATGIETYKIINQSYPVDENLNLNPLDDSSAELSQYLNVWPTDANYTYVTSGNEMCISVVSAETENEAVQVFYKFTTLSTNKVCEQKVLQKCSQDCSAGVSDVSGCFTLDNKGC